MCLYFLTIQIAGVVGKSATFCVNPLGNFYWCTKTKFFNNVLFVTVYGIANGGTYPTFFSFNDIKLFFKHAFLLLSHFHHHVKYLVFSLLNYSC